MRYRKALPHSNMTNSTQNYDFQATQPNPTQTFLID